MDLEMSMLAMIMEVWELTPLAVRIPEHHPLQQQAPLTVLPTKLL
jgi:hypothetical protein